MGENYFYLFQVLYEEIYNMARAFFLSHFERDIQNITVNIHLSIFNQFGYRRSLLRYVATKLPLKAADRLDFKSCVNEVSYGEEKSGVNQIKESNYQQNGLNQAITPTKPVSSLPLENDKIKQLELELEFLKTHIAQIVNKMEQKSIHEEPKPLSTVLKPMQNIPLPPPPTMIKTAPRSNISTISNPLKDSSEVVQPHSNEYKSKPCSLPTLLPNFINDIGKVQLRKVVPNCRKKDSPSSHTTCECLKCRAPNPVKCDPGTVAPLSERTKNKGRTANNFDTRGGVRLMNDPATLIANALARKFEKASLHETSFEEGTPDFRDGCGDFGDYDTGISSNSSTCT